MNRISLSAVLLSLGCVAPNSGKLTSIGQASAVFDDVVFTWDGTGQPPEQRQLRGAAIRSGSQRVLVRTPGHHRRVQRTPGDLLRRLQRQLGEGEIVWDVTGNRGQSLLGSHRLETPNVPVEVPVTITMSLFVASQAALKQVGSPAVSSASEGPGVGNVSGLAATGGWLAPGEQGMQPKPVVFAPCPVFDLPEGFTVNSVSMGLVDNLWVAAPVPEPAPWLLFLAGSGVLAWRRGPAATPSGRPPGAGGGRIRADGPQGRQRGSAASSDAVPRQRHHHHVYVVELSDRVWNEARFRRANPEHRLGMPCVYVGMTGLDPDLRFDRHKAGVQANRYVHAYGLRLLPALYEVYNPMPYAAACEMEVELAVGLREAGYAVWQG